jgi:1,4-dihydroxy-2-naphthoyl-CoA synthase
MMFWLFWADCTKSFAQAYTPAVGSPERIAIANAVRASVAQLGDQFAEDARRGAKFVIAVLKVEGRYAFFEGGGQEVNGETTYGPVDIVAFLAKGNSGWKVLNLQARGDVPDESVIAQLRSSLPRDYPFNIVNKFWRDLLLGIRQSD